jgi:alkaline phosphatase
LKHQNISAQEFGRTLLNFKQNNGKASFEELMQLVEKHFGLGNGYKGLELTKEEEDYLYEGYKLEFVDKVNSNPDDDYLNENEALLITDRVITIMSKKAGVGWTTPNHTGTSVPLRALGSGQEYFKTYLDNTDVPKLIGKVMGI